jgi:hypothetical protein
MKIKEHKTIILPVACMGKSRRAYWALVGKPGGKRPLGNPDVEGG